MKKLLLASFATLAVLSGSALAADLPAKPTYKAAPMPAPVYNWTGCYVSAGWGYGFVDDQRDVHGLTTAPRTDSAARGWLAAFGGGCDYQFNGVTPFGPIVVGVFGDYDPSNIKGQYGDPLDAFQTGTFKERDAWYVGGRAGVLITPQFLTYFDGGYTGAHFNSVTLSTFDTLPSKEAHGWFLGSGFEYSFNWLPINGLFWKTEYRYASYQDYDQNYIHPTFVGTRAIVNSTIYTQTVMTSLVYRFNWTGH
jgi:outer membrane immunogenic protein